jgi:phytoene dehydrogenase-like protein
MEMVHDTIVIGSGIGGLACACALAKCGHRVLVLEQHYSAGGLTSTFSRKGFTWNVGILYLGEMGPKGQARRLLDWLSNGAIRMAPIGSAYDIVHFPDDFKIIFESPAEALRQNLKERFPQSSGEIDVFFCFSDRWPVNLLHRSGCVFCPVHWHGSTRYGRQARFEGGGEERSMKYLAK